MSRRVMVSEQFITFETEGISQTGVLTRRDPITVENREVKQYKLTNGRAVMIFNGTMKLDDALENVKDGEEVEIIYTGSEQTANNQTVKKFEVYVLENEDDDAQS